MSRETTNPSKGDLTAAVERCRSGEGSLEDYKAAFEFSDAAVAGLRQKLNRQILLAAQEDSDKEEVRA